MKIGFVFDDSLDTTDGIQQYLLALGEWLRAKGHEVHYLVGQTSRRDILNIHSVSRNIGWEFNGNRGTMPLPASRRRLRQLLDDEQFYILHVQVPYSPFMAHRVIKLAGPQTAVIGTFHVAPNSRLMTVGTTALGIWLRRSLRRFDAMLSVSTAAQAFARSSFGVKTEVLPNVIDYQRFSKAKPLAAYKDKLNIVFLGRLVPRKGCKTLLEATKLLAQQADLPAFRIVICGKGPLEAKLSEYVRTNGLEKFVTFTGFVSEADKPRYLQTADIAVFPSSGGESFGIVLLEAMAAGALVLAGDNAGYRTVMEPQPELLFAPTDASLLADKLAHFLQDTTARQALVDWEHDYVQAFDVNVVGQQLVKAYTKALLEIRNV